MKIMRNSPDKKPTEKLKIDEIFKPGTVIDVVFDIDADVPIVRSSIIHDCKYEKSQMIISQPYRPILPSFQYNTLNITTVVEKELNEKFRCGIHVEIKKFIADYAISNQVKENAILIAYKTPVEELNIRSAYRLSPGFGFKVQGIITFKGNKYSSKDYFKVKDISFTGIGIICVTRLKDKTNPLFSADIGEDALTELQLTYPSGKSSTVKIESKINIVRKKLTANNETFSLGIKFLSLAIEHERLLSKFIHDAQLVKIKEGGRR